MSKRKGKDRNKAAKERKRKEREAKIIKTPPPEPQADLVVKGEVPDGIKDVLQPPTDMKKKARICICVPVPSSSRAELSANWVIALINLIVYTEQHALVMVAFDDIAGYGPSRNALTHRALGYKTDMLFWLDSDTIVPEDTIARLAAHEKGVVGALYFTKTGIPAPVAYNIVDGRPKHIKEDQWKGKDLVEVEAMGMGAVLIQSWVYALLSKRMPIEEPDYDGLRVKHQRGEKTAYTFYHTHQDEAGKLTGEDVFFFHMLRKYTKVRPLVDLTIPTDHMGTVTSFYNPKDGEGVRLL